VRRLAVGDDTVLGVQVQRARPTGGAAQLVLTPLKPGVSSLMVWPQGTGAARHYVLTVRQRSGQEGRVHQPGSPCATHGGDKAAQEDAGVVLLKSHVVQVDVKVVEINKNRMQQAGINLFSTRSNSQGFRFGVLSAGATGSTAFGSRLAGAGCQLAFCPGLWPAAGFRQGWRGREPGHARRQWHGAGAGRAVAGDVVRAERQFPGRR
jgi:pilus assembly protein CpaC